MKIVGVAAMAAGVGLGILGAISWSNYRPSCTVEKDGGGCSEVNAAPVAVAIGVTMAIGGLVACGIGQHKFNTLTDSEEAALSRYYPPGSSRPQKEPPSRSQPEYSSGWSTSAAGRAFALSLLSFTF